MGYAAGLLAPRPHVRGSHGTAAGADESAADGDGDGDADGAEGAEEESASSSSTMAEGVRGYASALSKAVRKYDLGSHAPTPDKSDHVSNVTEKQMLRDILMSDHKLRPLLRGMRQLLDYETLPTWQPPPDLTKLSAAVDAALSQFWKDVKRGTVGSRLVSRGHAAKNSSHAHAPRVPMDA